MGAARAELRSLPRVEPSPDFLPRLEARIAALETVRLRRRRVARVVGRAGSGLALVAAVVSTLWLRAAGEQPRPAPASALALESAGAAAGGAIVRGPVLAAARRGAVAWPAGAAGGTARSFDPSPPGVAARPFERAGDAAPTAPVLDWSLLLASAAPGSVPRSFGFSGGRGASVQPVLYAAPSLTFAAAPVSLRFAPAASRPRRPRE
jgi:hypothetical protein